MLRVIISGKGGQGIKFISTIFAKSSIENGKFVTLTASYGPEARGGSSQCSMVIDNKPITNPIIKNADYLLAFTQDAVNMWKAENVIYHDNINNMEMLGIFIKTIGEDIEPIIDTMKQEISSKYTDRIQVNIDNLMKGFNSIKYIPKL